VGHVARTGQIRCVYKILDGNLKGRDHLEDLGEDGRILQLISGKQSGKVWIGFVWLRAGTRCGGHRNEPSGTIKGREFLH
jgi:hypothetical protein